MKPQFKLLRSMVVGVIASTMITSTSLAAEGKPPKKESKKSIAELIKDKTEFEGFLDFYQDPKTGSMMLALDESQFNKPFLYHTHTVNGVLDAGHFKGAFRTSRLLEFRKAFDKIEVVSTTPRYLLDSESAIARSEGTNISPAILDAIKIEAYDKEKGRYLIKVDGLLLSETLEKVSPYPRPPVPGQPPRPTFKVGSLSKSKTKYTDIRAYPKNNDVVVEYVFDNKAPMVRGSQAVSDPRTVAVQLQHSFIELPENNFQPRADDPRVGYFHQQFDNLTTEGWVTYQDVINRWHLEKKDPEAALSEPVEPITWWIENTTPVEWRDTIKQAAEAWNIAFEKAGFKNALVVKVQPDDAEWDAGDIRYNVMRWTASPRPPFGGYGPSVANPLTGQIIAADIMLEYIFMQNRGWIDELYSLGGEAVSMDLSHTGITCSAGHYMQASNILGRSVLNMANASVDEITKLEQQSLSYLILHELGHTLGLNHNMKASQLFDATEIHDETKTQGIVAGSVMDYPAINVAPPGVSQGDFYNVKPGPYDLWIIEYGYSVGLADAEKEQARLAKILNRSTEAALAFGNDAEDMRSPGRHIDPRIMIGDLSSEAVKYAADRIELVRATFEKLQTKGPIEGESYQPLLSKARILLGEWANQTGIMTRYVGGVYVDRAFAGQPGATQPYSPVPKALQQEAIDNLSKYLFAPDIMQQAEPLFAYLQPQRRGFSGYGRNEDPKIHDLVLNTQKRALDHLLHQNVLKRVSDSALYGNEYSLNQLLSDLTNGIFNADLRTEVNTYRQNLQVEYVKRLLKIVDKKSSYDYLSQAAALAQLATLERKMKYNRGSGDTRVHRAYLHSMIEQSAVL